jgi:hypothetical protein
LVHYNAFTNALLKKGFQPRKCNENLDIKGISPFGKWQTKYGVLWD